MILTTLKANIHVELDSWESIALKRVSLFHNSSQMLQAQLKGKLYRNEEDLEDLLTSNVFGSIKYVLPEQGLIPLLANAEQSDASLPLMDMGKISDVKYDFWPRIHEQDCYGSEPDVLIRFENENGEKFLLMVEAKYRSGKSPKSGNGKFCEDQLACEWDNLVHLARAERSKPFLIFVTDHFSYPLKDIKDSQLAWAKNPKAVGEINVVWLPWRKLNKIFSEAEEEILKDLAKVLRKLGLKFFDGISKCEYITLEWSYLETTYFEWSSIQTQIIKWKYESHTRRLGA